MNEKRMNKNELNEQANEQAAESPFKSWAIVELMGHRRLGGLVSEATLAGKSFLRIDVPGEPPLTKFQHPDSVYAIAPCGEAEARAVARGNTPDPVRARPTSTATGMVTGPSVRARSCATGKRRSARPGMEGEPVCDRKQVFHEIIPLTTGPGEAAPLNIEVRAEDNYVALRPVGQRTVCQLHVINGELRLLVWDRQDQDRPTHDLLIERR